MFLLFSVCLAYPSTLKMEAVYFSENFVDFYQTWGIYIPVTAVRTSILSPTIIYIYIKAKWAGWLTFYLCVPVARRRWAVAMQRGRFLFGQFSVCFLVTTTMGWYFLSGPFRGGISFGVRSEVVFSLGSVPRVYFFVCFWGCYWKRGKSAVSKFCESEMATKDTHLVLWSTRATPGISASLT
jgi:hypothetical protein